MGIKAAIRSILLAEPSISGVVGTRVSPVLSGTTAVLPRIVYVRTGSESTNHNLGTLSLRFDNFNFSVMADSSDACDSLTEDVRASLEAIINETHSGIIIHRCLFRLLSETHQFFEGREKPVYESMMMFEVSYQYG